MVAPRNVPIHPLTDYGPEMSAGQQFFVGRFEHSITSRPNRLRFHRHTYYEVFWTSVSDYAKYLHVTADHLGAVVRDQTGRTPGDIIRERLLLEAKRLLVHTSMNISEIAYALNFEDPAYFSRFFRRLVAKAPGDFREAFSEKHQT
jgi:AraC-like DNA-binding protein